MELGPVAEWSGGETKAVFAEQESPASLTLCRYPFSVQQIGPAIYNSRALIEAARVMWV